MSADQWHAQYCDCFSSPSPSFNYYGYHHHNVLPAYDPPSPNAQPQERIADVFHSIRNETATQTGTPTAKCTSSSTDAPLGACTARQKAQCPCCGGVLCEQTQTLACNAGALKEEIVEICAKMRSKDIYLW